MAVDQIKKTLFGILGGFGLFLLFLFFSSNNHDENVGKVRYSVLEQPKPAFRSVDELSDFQVGSEFPSSNVDIDKEQTENMEEGGLNRNESASMSQQTGPFANVPDELKQFAPQLFKEFPTEYDPSYKSPCWHEGKQLHCLPYFYQIGMPKCGTTDLWDKIVQHPQVQGVPKEPHWWARRRLGWTDVPIHPNQVKRIRKKTGAGDDRPFLWYTNWFDEFAVPKVKNNRRLIFGDGSVSTSFYIGSEWRKFFPEAKEPPYVLADLMHSLQPNAKIVVIVREPVSRMYSAYLYTGGKNNEHFHQNVLQYLDCEKQCEDINPEQTCAYMAHDCKLFRGMYEVFIKDWIKAYGREQVLVLRLDDWMSDPINQFRKLVLFLDLDDLSDDKIRQIVHRKVKNSQNSRKERAGPILPATEKLLQKFYRPWNKKLAELLNDTRFLWDY